MSDSSRITSAPRVLVYGTLKRGFVNFPAMQGLGVTKVQKALLRGVRLYNLLDPGRPYPYPALLRGHGAILGELHTLPEDVEPEDALRVLDHLELEGYEYRRVRCWVRLRGQMVRAWVYLYASSGLLHRKSGVPYGQLWWRARSV
jgi:gamma-glutamylcyclotransferase (GGCT)/AIG2-like uncharacterized protein YtfP